MVAVTLDGVATATAVKERLAERITALAARGITPGLGTLLVGSDPGSQSYVAGKHRDCAEVGIRSIRVDLPETATAGGDPGCDRITQRRPCRHRVHHPAAAAGGHR